MRISGGIARGCRLLGPKDEQRFLRPTCDRVREALFNILGRRVQNAVTLDLFAGTGAWGLEALSRGARAVLFVDESPEAGRLVAANLRHCLPEVEAAGQAGFLRLRLGPASRLGWLAEKMPAPHLFDLVFMDPPYQKNLAAQVLKRVEEAQILSPQALVVAEEHQAVVLPERVGRLHAVDRRQYGESSLWLFALNSQSNGA